MEDPSAYFTTFTTYGTWLHGRSTGSVDKSHNPFGTPFLPSDSRKEASRNRSMEQEPYFLDELRRTIVLRTIREVARHRRWKLWASHVRTNHVHLFVTAPDKPEKVMADFKAWASRRLREAFDESVGRNRWTQHGSTRWLNDTIALDCSVAYVVDEQGETMACYDGRIAAEEPDA